MSALSVPNGALDAQVRLALAEQLADLEARFAEHSDDAGVTVVAALKAAANSRAVAEADFQPAPLPLDFDAVPDPPDWIVHRPIERGTVVVLSGDTGSAKSIVTASLIPAALNGDDWLGRSTAVERILIVDEENPDRLAAARLRALGMTNDLREQLRYYSREGLSIGDGGDSDAWLRAQLEDFAPDLLVIDTLMAACAVQDTNSNSEAVRVMKHLRGLARDYGCAVLLLHHERKRSNDHPASSGQAMMGARQWAGQADAHMTLTVESDFTEEAKRDGGTHTRRTFKFRPAEKDRDGRVNGVRRLAVESERDAAGRMLSMTVTDEGAATEESAQDAHQLAILRALRELQGDETMARKDLAAAAGESNPSDPSGTFKRALSDLIDAAHVETVSRRYRLTMLGRRYRLPEERQAGLGL